MNCRLNLFSEVRLSGAMNYGLMKFKENRYLYEQFINFRNRVHGEFF